MEQHQKELTIIDLDNELIDHSNLVLNNLEKLYLNDEFSDITLVIDSNEIPAHKGKLFFVVFFLNSISYF